MAGLFYISLLLVCCCCCYCHAFTARVRTTKSTIISRIFPRRQCQPRSKKRKIIQLRRMLLLSSSSTDTNNMNEEDDIYVMVNGMPGPMATAAAEACLRKGLQLSPIAMTGPNVESSRTITVIDPITKRNANVRLISSTNRDEMISSLAGIRAALGSSNIYAIDYTHPSAVNGMLKNHH